MANCIQSFSDHGKFLISTVGKIVVNVWQIDFQDFKSLQPCSHKETDTRILLHVAYCAKQGYRRIVIRTINTDIVVLAVAHFQYLDNDELWICFE